MNAETVVAQRRVLVDACIAVAEQVSSAGLRDVLLGALAEVGVVPIVSDGERFDPARHEAVGRAAPRRGQSHNTITATERPGWRDRGDVLRLPQVVVARRDAEVTR